MSEQTPVSIEESPVGGPILHEDEDKSNEETEKPIMNQENKPKTTETKSTETKTEEVKPSNDMKPSTTEIDKKAEEKPKTETETETKPVQEVKGNEANTVSTSEMKEEKLEAKKEAKTESMGPVDEKVTFKGFGIVGKEPGYNFQPVSYHPRKLGPTDVEVKISHCSVCYSDLHTASGGWGPIQADPLIVGHEIVGKVVAKGPKAKYKIGDRVGVGPLGWACLNQDKKNPCRGCSRKNENHCQKRVFLYDGRYPDGELCQGGYCEAIRVQQEFAFPIPKSLESKYAAPLMCAGVTVYAPLVRYKVNKNTRVGIIGIGGLGHLALQFASKMGATVYAISTSIDKTEEVKKLGAKELINISDEKQYESIKGTLDLVICTANAKDMDWRKYISLCQYEAHFVLLAIPEDKIQFNPGDIVQKQINLVGSIIGSRKETEEMLKFAADKKIFPMIEEFPMDKVNEAVQKVKENTVKYRAVLTNPEPESEKKK